LIAVNSSVGLLFPTNIGLIGCYHEKHPFSFASSTG